jgi:hypothetical protein
MQVTTEMKRKVGKDPGEGVRNVRKKFRLQFSVLSNQSTFLLPAGRLSETLFAQKRTETI